MFDVVNNIILFFLISVTTLDVGLDMLILSFGEISETSMVSQATRKTIPKSSCKRTQNISWTQHCWPNPTIPKVSIVGCYIARLFACTPYCMLLQVVACCWEQLLPFVRRLKVMLHGTIRIDDFQRNTALQCWNNVVTIQNNVATMLQRCVVLKITVENRPRVISPLYRSRCVPKKR